MEKVKELAKALYIKQKELLAIQEEIFKLSKELKDTGHVLIISDKDFSIAKFEVVEKNITIDNINTNKEGLNGI